MRLTLALLLATAVALAPGLARGEQDAQAACFDDFALAQKGRREGVLLQSRAALKRCARPSCPTAIVDKCIGWLDEVNASIPSFVIAARGRDGKDTSRVRVSLDGEVIAEALDGRPIEADPGPHDLLLEHRGERVTRRLLLTAGEKNKRVEVSFAPTPEPVPPTAPAPKPAPPSQPDEAPLYISPLVWVGLGVTVVGLVGGAVTGGLALARADELEAQCPGGACGSEHESTLDEGAQLAHASTALFVVAGAGAALGVIGLVLSGDGHDEHLSFWVSPGGARLEGRF